MSKRYVIQVKIVSTFPGGDEWINVQHPAGGDWLTRSKTTALADAAKLIQAGETRELRIGISQPVYSVTPLEGFDHIAIKNAAEVIAPDAWDTDEDADEAYDGQDDDDDDDDDESEDVAPAAFEVVDESKN